MILFEVEPEVVFRFGMRAVDEENECGKREAVNDNFSDADDNERYPAGKIAKIEGFIQYKVADTVKAIGNGTGGVAGQYADEGFLPAFGRLEAQGAAEQDAGGHKGEKVFEDVQQQDHLPGNECFQVFAILAGVAAEEIDPSVAEQHFYQYKYNQQEPGGEWDAF